MPRTLWGFVFKLKAVVATAVNNGGNSGEGSAGVRVGSGVDSGR